jgi:hypothetical protein
VEFLTRIYGKGYGIPATYYDAICIEVQCNKGKSRSFIELYYIAKQYFPRISREAFAVGLKEFLLFNKKKRQLIFCPDIKKIVINSGWSYDKNNHKQYYVDRLVYNYRGLATRFKNKEKEGEVSLMQILLLMGYSQKYLNKALKKRPKKTVKADIAPAATFNWAVQGSAPALG